MLSKEKAKKEIAWTEGAYVPPGEIAAAFALKEPLPPPEGVGACQPWPHAETSHLWWKTAWLLSLASIVVFFLAKLLTPHAVVYDQTFDLTDPQRVIYAARGGRKRPPRPTGRRAARRRRRRVRRTRAAARAAAEAALSAARVLVSEPFETKRGANLAVDLWAPTNNNWVQVGFDLISEAHRRGPLVRPDLGPLLGRRRRRELERRQPEPPHLRAAHSRRAAGSCASSPSPRPGRRRPRSACRLTSGVPHVSHLVWVIVFLFVVPTLLAFRKITFEGRRWAESDFTSAGAGTTNRTTRTTNEGGPMRRIFQVFGGALLLTYALAAFSGWETAGNTKRNTLPPGARNAGGYRTWHFWSGGK